MPGTSPCLCPQPLRNGRVTSFPLKPQSDDGAGFRPAAPEPRREMGREPARRRPERRVLPAPRRGHEKQARPGPRCYFPLHGEPAVRPARPPSAPPSPRAQPPGRSLSQTGDPTAPHPCCTERGDSGVTHGPLAPAPGRTQKAQRRRREQRGPLLSSHPPRTAGSGPEETSPLSEHGTQQRVLVPAKPFLLHASGLSSAPSLSRFRVDAFPPGRRPVRTPARPTSAASVRLPQATPPQGPAPHPRPGRAEPGGRAESVCGARCHDTQEGQCR